VVIGLLTGYTHERHYLHSTGYFLMALLARGYYRSQAAMKCQVLGNGFCENRHDNRNNIIIARLCGAYLRRYRLTYSKDVVDKTP